MTTKRTNLSLVAALVMGAAGLSFGGMRETREVQLYQGGYYWGAMGNVSDARNSADSLQYIGCEVSTYQTGGPYVWCYARNAANQLASCYLPNAPAAMVDQLLSIGPRSNIHFSYSASSAVCQWIRVANMSYAGGMP